jgi:hypothetical protein
VPEMRPPTGLLFIQKMSMEKHGGIVLTGLTRRTRRQMWPSDTLSTTKPTWTDLGLKANLLGERPVTNCLSHGTAVFTPSWDTSPTLTVFTVDYGMPFYRFSVMRTSSHCDCDTI